MSSEGAVATGKLWGVGLGPGDPELVTVKAARIITEADVIAFHSARHGRSISRGIAAPYMRPGQLEEHLVYPVTTETTDPPGGYQGAIDEFYAEAAERLAAHLTAGRTVALLAAGCLVLTVAGARQRRTADLRALDLAGVEPRVGARATRWSLLVPVAAGVLIGRPRTAK